MWLILNNVAKIIKVLTVVATVILISNIIPIRILIEPIINSYPYETQNTEFAFTVIPEKGRDTEMMERQFQKFLKENPQSKDTIIYRTFKRNPLKFWNWSFYMTSDLYKYQVKNYHNNGYNSALL